MEPESRRVSLTKPSRSRSQAHIPGQPPSAADISPSAIPQEVPRSASGYRSGENTVIHMDMPRPTGTPADTWAKFCQHCGQALTASDVTCPCCGSPTGAVNTGAAPQVVVNNYISSTPVNSDSTPQITEAVPRNKWIALVLCLMFGYLGAHKFYEGKIGMGILYLLTMGLFGIGIFVDMIVILTKPTTYYC